MKQAYEAGKYSAQQKRDAVYITIDSSKILGDSTQTFTSDISDIVSQYAQQPVQKPIVIDATNFSYGGIKGDGDFYKARGKQLISLAKQFPQIKIDFSERFYAEFSKYYAALKDLFKKSGSNYRFSFQH